MQITPFFILMIVLAVVLAVFLNFKMVNRQREALQKEGKSLPPNRSIFWAGLFPVLFYMGTAFFAVLMMIAPFTSLYPAAPDNGSTLFLVLLFASSIVATLIYWFFVRLGMLSWKVLTTNS
jgi:hypothetical protein